MADLRRIDIKNAPAAIGPYSQAIITGNMVFTAGQIPLDPESMEVVGEDIVEQTHRSLKNLQAILEAAGASFDTVVKTTVYLEDMSEFAAMNEVYASYFTNNKPARSTVQAARLPKNVKVEIDAIAMID